MPPQGVVAVVEAAIEVGGLDAGLKAVEQVDERGEDVAGGVAINETAHRQRVSLVLAAHTRAEVAKAYASTRVLLIRDDTQTPVPETYRWRAGARRLSEERVNRRCCPFDGQCGSVRGILANHAADPTRYAPAVLDTNIFRTNCEMGP